ncbi:hypothetical protein ACQRWP_11885 [Micromonospora trifolii]
MLLAAVASERAASTARLELYPGNLDPVRALRLARPAWCRRRARLMVGGA